MTKKMGKLLRKYIKANLITTAFLFTHSAIAEPTVSGHFITMPDDGWYQVQNASTYESICKGVLSCEVESGTYIVTNHSTGMRYDGIRVGSGLNENIILSEDSKTITWPNDGWYQVQSIDTYETVCAGGSSCVVEHGVYHVINHTTGERFENIVAAPSLTKDSSIALLKEAFSVFTGQGYKDTLSGLPGYYADFIPLVSTWYDSPTACYLSGEYEYLPIQGGLEPSAREDYYIFNQCDDGVSELNGSMRVMSSSDGHTYVAQDFTSKAFYNANEGEVKLSGSVTYDPDGRLGVFGSGYEHLRLWTSKLDYFSDMREGRFFQLSKVDTSFDHNSPSGDGYAANSTLMGHFSMLTKNTYGLWIHAETLKDFQILDPSSDFATPHYDEGFLVLYNGYGEWLKLDADSGIAGFAKVEYGFDDVVEDTFYLEWSELADSLTPVSH